MLEFKYDTQLLIEGKGLDEDEIDEYIKANFKGEYRKACLILLAHDTGRAKVNL